MVSREREVFREVFRQNIKDIFGYVSRRIKSGHDAEDLAQEVFAVFWKNISGFIAEYPENIKGVRAWLFKVADFKIMHYLEDATKKTNTEISLELMPDLPVNDDPEHLAADILPNWITEEDKKLLELKLQGYKLNEIADKLGITYGACRMRSARLLNDLREYFNKVN